LFAVDNQNVLESGVTLIKEEEAEAPVEVHQFYTVKYPLHNVDGHLNAVGGISIDISERKRAEEALRKANDLLRLAVVVRDSEDAITVQDLDGQIIAWNPGAVRLYGWSEAEALTMNVRDRIPEGLREAALAMVIQLSRAEILAPYLTQRITKDGRVIEVSMTSTALVNEAGAMYAIATTERARSSMAGLSHEGSVA
jgi:two-component system CheB/CheR fusion protein